MKHTEVTETNTLSDKAKAYKNASGKLKANLRNDLLFHYVVQKSKPVLKSLICSLKGLSPEVVIDVTVTNPIDYAKYTGKQVVLDVRVILNNAEILDIELQMYHDIDWENRSILYLCRSFNSIGSGDDYKALKPTTFIAIMKQDLFPAEAEFYSHFLLMHEEKHYPYSTNLRLNVLYLNRAELATETDKANKLDYWASLFQSDTWEDLKRLAVQDPLGEEVAEVMYEAMIQSEEQTMFEAHQRYLDYLSAAKRSGLAEGYDKGYEQHLITQICKKLARGLSADQIALEVEEDPARVATICNIAKKYAPKYDVESIASELHETPKAD